MMSRVLIPILIASASLWSVLPAYGAEKLPGDRTGRFWKKDWKGEPRWFLDFLRYGVFWGTDLRRAPGNSIFGHSFYVEALKVGCYKGENAFGIIGFKGIGADMWYKPEYVHDYKDYLFRLSSLLPLWYERILWRNSWNSTSYYIEGSFWAYTEVFKESYFYYRWKVRVGPYVDVALISSFIPGHLFPLSLKVGVQWIDVPNFLGAPKAIWNFYISFDTALRYCSLRRVFRPPKGIYISLLHLTDADGDKALSIGERGRVLLGLANGADKVRVPKVSVEVKEVEEAYKGYVRIEVKPPKASPISPEDKSLLEFEVIPYMQEELKTLLKDFRFQFKLKVKVEDNKGFVDEQEEEFVVVPSRKEVPVVQKPSAPPKPTEPQRPRERQKPSTELDPLPPVILVTSPKDGDVVGKKVRIEGVVVDNSQVAEVRVEDVPMVRSQGRGIKVVPYLGFEVGDEFHFQLEYVPKAPGENEIVISARDAYGNETRKVVRVVYRPALAPKTKVWAVVVGVSKFVHPNVRGLKYADKDAISFYDYLRSPYGGAVEHDKAKLLVNERATRAEILKAVKDVLKRAFEDDMVILYFATHGMVDADTDELYFLGYDTDPTNLLATGIAQSDLERLMRISKAGKVVFITDACHSGGLGIALAMRGQEEVARFLAKVAEAKDGIAVLSASSANEFSQEGERWGGGHGVFTYYLLRGLKGEADFDADGIVTIREVYDYLYRKVAEDTAGGQHPELKGNFDNNLPLGIVR